MNSDDLNLWIIIAVALLGALLLSWLTHSGKLTEGELEAIRIKKQEENERLRKARWQTDVAWLRELAEHEFQLVSTLRDLSPEKLIDAASPTEFETLIGLLVEADGWSVTMTGSGSDGGVDFTYGKDGQILGVGQVKHQRRSNVGRPVLQQMLGIAATRGLRDVILATSGEFAETVHRYKSETTRVRLWNRAAVLHRLERSSPELRARIASELPQAAYRVTEELRDQQRHLTMAPPPPECHGPSELHEEASRRISWVCAECERRIVVSHDAEVSARHGAYPVIRWDWLRYRSQVSMADKEPLAKIREIRKRKRDQRPGSRRYRRRRWR